MGRRKPNKLEREAAKYGITVERKETLVKKHEHAEPAWTWVFSDSCGVVLKWYPDLKSAHLPRKNQRIKVQNEWEAMKLAARHAAPLGSIETRYS